jgi:ABC-type nitrate/sulfonate/bicarbonate transport system substrate-binding protein
VEQLPAASIQLQVPAADIGLTGGAPLISAHSGGAGLKIGFAMGTQASAANGSAILVRPAQVTGASRAREDRLGRPTGSAGHYLLLIALERVGMDASGVDAVLDAGQSRAASNWWQRLERELQPSVN